MKSGWRYFYFYFCFLYFIPTHALQIEDKWATQKAQCKPQNSSHRVYILKQWHLAPLVNTFANPKIQAEQLENQRSLYLLVSNLIEKSQKFILLAEGCEGEINNDFKPEFNGWSFSKLKVASKELFYPEILSSVPLKVEAKYGEKIKTLCADDIKLVKEHSLAFSDARGSLGFLMRMEQYKNEPPKLKQYLNVAVEAYHLNKEASALEVRKKIILQLGEAIDKVNQLFLERNQHFISEIEKQKEDVVLVVGGAHASQLKDLLEKKKLACEIWEPKGYRSQDETLFPDLEKAYKSLK